MRTGELVVYKVKERDGAARLRLLPAAAVVLVVASSAALSPPSPSVVVVARAAARGHSVITFEAAALAVPLSVPVSVAVTPTTPAALLDLLVAAAKHLLRAL